MIATISGSPSVPARMKEPACRRRRARPAAGSGVGAGKLPAVSGARCLPTNGPGVSRIFRSSSSFSQRVNRSQRRSSPKSGNASMKEPRRQRSPLVRSKVNQVRELLKDTYGIGALRTVTALVNRIRRVRAARRRGSQSGGIEELTSVMFPDAKDIGLVDSRMRVTR